MLKKIKTLRSKMLLNYLMTVFKKIMSYLKAVYGRKFLYVKLILNFGPYIMAES